VRKVLAGCLIALLTISGARAQAQQIACMDWDETMWLVMADAVAGPWQVRHLTGVAYAGGMAIPFPGDGEVDTLTFATVDDRLQASHPQMQQPMVFTVADQTPWEFDAIEGMPQPTLTNQDIELLTDCPVHQLPRLIGETRAVVDGTEMQFTWFVIFVGLDAAFVIQHATATAHGIAVFTKRSVALTR